MLSRAGNPIFTAADAPINPWVELETFLDRSNDYFFANLESPLGFLPSPADDMNLCADPSEVRLLKEGYLDGLTLANNHVKDCQAGGAVLTAQILADDGFLSTTGAGDVLYLDTSQGMLALIAANTLNESFSSSALLDEVRIAASIADLVIVSIHWGIEYQAGVEDARQTLAQQLADAGADVIWGHHPHVLQRMQWLRSSDGRDVLVLYSLGNLLSDQFMLPDAQRSALVRLSFHDSEIDRIEIVPLFMNQTDRTLDWMADQQQHDWITQRLGLGGLSKPGVLIEVSSPK